MLCMYVYAYAMYAVVCLYVRYLCMDISYALRCSLCAYSKYVCCVCMYVMCVCYVCMICIDVMLKFACYVRMSVCYVV